MLGEIKENNKGTKMKIIAQRSNYDIDVEFLDNHHYVFKHAKYQNFKNGAIKNPFDITVFGKGYLGDGEYSGWINGEHTEEYEIWKGIIKRCYCEKQSDVFNSYYNISEVCDEWLNFQNFAQWYDNHKYECDGRLHIDKDIKYPGNKIYSPYHCLLVPQRINMMFMNKPNKYNLPSGIAPIANGRYNASYRGKSIGNYDTLELAVKAHDTEKKKALIELANEYKYKIPNKLYEALINWQPESLKCM